MGWVNDVAAEIDRLVVATHGRAGTMFAEHELSQTMRAHPGLVNGLGGLLVEAPMELGAVEIIYPYLPEQILQLLIQNNVDEGVVIVEDGMLRATEAGEVPARLASDLLDRAADAMWAGSNLDAVEQTTSTLVTHGRTVPPPLAKSAFTIMQVLVDGPTQAGRVFRLLSALRYWRADAHRAAWGEVGLSVGEAHALNRLWDIDRGAERVGQGEERPGRRGVAALTARGYAADDAITELGRKAREAIEADTDARTEPIYAPLDDAARTAFLDGLRELPIS